MRCKRYWIHGSNVYPTIICDEDCHQPWIGQADAGRETENDSLTKGCRDSDTKQASDEGRGGRSSNEVLGRKNAHQAQKVQYRKHSKALSRHLPYASRNRGTKFVTLSNIDWAARKMCVLGDAHAHTSPTDLLPWFFLSSAKEACLAGIFSAKVSFREDIARSAPTPFFRMRCQFCRRERAANGKGRSRMSPFYREANRTRCRNAADYPKQASKLQYTNQTVDILTRHGRYHDCSHEQKHVHKPVIGVWSEQCSALCTHV